MTNFNSNNPDDFMGLGDKASKSGKFEQAAYAYALAASMYRDQRDQARNQLEAESTALGLQMAHSEIWVTTPRHVSSNQQIPAMEWLNENERIGKLYITPGGRKQFGRHYRVTARHLGNKPKLNRKGELVITPDEAPVFQATLEYMEQYSQTANMIALDR